MRASAQSAKPATRRVSSGALSRRRSAPRLAPARPDGWSGLMVRATVFGSAGVAALAAMLPSAPEKLPGAALGSALMLRVEWAVGIFAALLLAVVVLFHAWQGALPTEISGRGVNYADPEATQAAIDQASEAIARLRAEVASLRREHLELEAHTRDSDASLLCRGERARPASSRDARTAAHRGRDRGKARRAQIRGRRDAAAGDRSARRSRPRGA